MARWDELSAPEKEQARAVYDRLLDRPQAPKELALSFAIPLTYLRRIISALASRGAISYSYPRNEAPQPFGNRIYGANPGRFPMTPEEFEAEKAERRQAAWQAIDDEEHYSSSWENASEFVDGVFTPTAPYVLIEKSRYNGCYWASQFDRDDAASEYHDNQENPEDWQIVALYNLDTGQKFVAETRTVFVPAPTLVQS